MNENSLRKLADKLDGLAVIFSALTVVGLLVLFFCMAADVLDIPAGVIIGIAAILNAVLVYYALHFAEHVLLALADIEEHTKTTADSTKFTADEYKKQLGAS